MNYLNLLKP